MTYLDPRDHPVWKTHLLAGRVDIPVAIDVARALSAVHRSTARRADMAADFQIGARTQTRERANAAMAVGGDAVEIAMRQHLGARRQMAIANTHEGPDAHATAERHAAFEDDVDIQIGRAHV